MPASRVPYLTGSEDGTGGARRDACTALHGPSDDIGVGLHWKNQLPNPRVFPQDTAHAGHTLWRVADAGGSQVDTQCLTHHEWYHTCMLVCFYNSQAQQRDRRQPPSAVAGPLKRASGGGYLRQTLRTMPKRRIYLPEWRRPGVWPGGRIWRGMLANHLGSSNHFVF